MGDPTRPSRPSVGVRPAWRPSAEAAVDKASWQRAGVKSGLAMPLSVAGQIEGAIAFDYLRHESTWPKDLVARIRVLATIFGNALAHKRAQEALAAAMDFERTVSDLLAELLTAGRSELDRVIEAALRDTARLLGAERATLWQRLGDKIAFAKTHRWLAEGVPVPLEQAGAVELPWISARLVAGSVVRFGRQADLPPEAASDLAALRALAVGAAIVVPLVVSGAVVGALSYATTRDEHDWPDALVPRVQLLGEVFASVLARQEAERREHEAEVQAAHAARVGTISVFAASLAHELTQPLSAILSNAQAAQRFLARDPPETERVVEILADIVKSDKRAGEIIARLRSLLRKEEAQHQPVDMNEVVQEVLALTRSDFLNRRVSVRTELAPQLPAVSGDRVQLQQVLLNLLINGCDAMAGSKTQRDIVVRSESGPGGNVRVSVADRGKGILPQDLERIFEPFVTTKPHGMGLGLAVCRSIVKAHNGKLSAANNPDGGATLSIALPANGSPTDAQLPSAGQARAGA